MIKRIYSITYNIYNPCGGVYKYALTPEFQKRTICFTQEQRDEFIKEYQRLSHPDKDMYIDEIKCYASKEIEDITDKMQEIIDAI